MEKCDIMIKKADKKREPTIMSELRQNLILQLNDANQTDYPLILHLCTLLLTWSTKQCMVHASGKFVPQLIAALKPSLSREVYDHFHECERLIVQYIKADKESPSRVEIESQLNLIIPKIKGIALNIVDINK